MVVNGVGDVHAVNIYVMKCVMFGFIVVRVTMYVCYVRNLRWPRTPPSQKKVGTPRFDFESVYQFGGEWCVVLAPMRRLVGHRADCGVLPGDSH